MFHFNVSDGRCEDRDRVRRLTTKVKKKLIEVLKDLVKRHQDMGLVATGATLYFRSNT